MIYALADGTLKVAFQDGLGDRPESFEPLGERSEPLFLTLLLRRESR